MEAQATDCDSQALSRQLRIDAVTYILQGLPTELSPHESLRIQNALPSRLQIPKNVSPEGYSPQHPPSLLHRGLASTIIVLCLLVRLLLPYLKYLSAQAYTYNQTHNIVQRVLTTTVSTTDSLGKKSLSIASTVFGNAAVLAAMTYCVDGVCGGLTEGLGEGIKAIDASSNPSEGR